MAVTTFAAPILPGKTEAWKAAAAQLTGARADGWDGMQRRMGITRQVVSLQETPHGDFVCVFIEGDDPANSIGQILASNEPFDKWFAEAVLLDTHGISRETGAPPANQLFVDWSA